MISRGRVIAEPSVSCANRVLVIEQRRLQTWLPIGAEFWAG